jgi:anti-anti-sigma factor
MFETTRQGVVDIIRGDMALNADGIVALRRVVDQLHEVGQPNVVLDLRKVPLVCSQGLEYLLDTYDRFRAQGGNLKLLAPTPLVTEILFITGVGQYFEVFSDEVSACGSFTR